MATVYIPLSPGDAALPTTNPAAPTQPQGTNFPVPGLAFDQTTQETAFFYFQALLYGSGNVTVEVQWYALTATTGTVIFGASLAAITPDTDTQNIETKAFATENTGTDTHLGTTAKRLMRCIITVTNLDSLAAADWVCLRLRRDISDTMADDAIVAKVIVSYSDT